MLDVLVQAKRDKAAASKLIRKLLKKQRIAPTEWVTDKYRVYGSVLRDLGTARRAHVTGKGIVTLTSYTAFFLDQPKTALNDFSGLARLGTPSEAA